MTSTASTTSVASMTSKASFHQKTFNLKKNVYFLWFATFYYLKKESKSQKISKFIKEQEYLTNWTIDGAQHQKNKTDAFGIKLPFSWTRRIQNISKNQNLYPHQSRITLYSLQWDTLGDFLIIWIRSLDKNNHLKFGPQKNNFNDQIYH